MKTTYTVTLPNGNKEIRKSDRSYSHVVAIRYNKWNNTTEQFDENSTWKVVRFAANQALAEKATSRYRKWASVKQIAVLPIVG